MTDLLSAIASSNWLSWGVLLFIASFMIGFVAVIGGVGGAILYVPVISSFFPFNIDFVRAAGLIVALTGSLAAAPRLLRYRLASIKLVIPMALSAAAFSIIGANVGLLLGSDLVYFFLGILILAVAIIISLTKRSEYPPTPKLDKLSQALAISGIYFDEYARRDVSWQAGRIKEGFLFFAAIGFIAGMFGLGAGWANVPVFNLVMGVPIKIAVASSGLLLTITDSAAVWVYINSGAFLPLLVVPSILGTFLGAKLASRYMIRINPRAIRTVVIIMMIISALRSIIKGLSI